MRRILRMVALGVMLYNAGTVWAAENIDLEVSTPAIQKLKEAQAARSAKIEEGKDFGYLGEARDGMLAVRSLAGVKLAEKKRLEDQVAAENADRKALYNEIARANNIKDEETPRLLALAARARRAASKAGHWVQRPGDGTWALAREVRE